MRRATHVMRSLLIAILAVLANHTHADPIKGSISLDTTNLQGTFEIVFILTDGTGSGDANNSVTLSDFAFGGGSAGSTDPLLTTGGASGSLSSSVVLVDSAFLNIFASTFMPGSVFSFDFAISTNADALGIPDQFSIVLLTMDGSVVPTSDVSGADALLSLNLDSPRPGFSTFASELTPAPTVHMVQEPGTLLLLPFGLIVALKISRRARVSGAVGR